MALTVRLLQNISLNTKKKIAKKEENPIAEVAKSVYRFYDSIPIAGHLFQAF